MGKPSPETESSSAIGKVFSGLVFIVAPLFAFWTLAALLVSQGLSRVIAGPLAGLVLVLPLGWHLFKERKRSKAGKARGGMLSGRDRLGLRVVVVAGVSLAVMFGLFRGQTTSALKRYADWPLHAPPERVHGSLEPSEMLALVPSASRVAMVDFRSAGGAAWARWVDKKLPKQLRGLDVHSIVWTREVAVVFSDRDLLIKVERRANKDGVTLPARGQGRYWHKKGSGAAYLTSRYIAWGSDITWIQSLADGKQAPPKATYRRLAAGVKSGAMLVLLDRSGSWIGLPGVTETAIAFHRSGSQIRIEATIRFPNPTVPHVIGNLESLVARAFGNVGRDGIVPKGKNEGLTIRRDGDVFHVELVRPASQIETIYGRALETGSVDARR